MVPVRGNLRLWEYFLGFFSLEKKEKVLVRVNQRNDFNQIKYRKPCIKLSKKPTATTFEMISNLDVNRTWLSFQGTAMTK